MNKPIIVLKFGSSVLRTAADLPRAVHEIFRYTRDGFGVIAVVSAFDGVTDRLLAQARALGPQHQRHRPPPQIELPQALRPPLV